MDDQERRLETYVSRQWMIKQEDWKNMSRDILTSYQDGEVILQLLPHQKFSLSSLDREFFPVGRDL